MTDSRIANAFEARAAVGAASRALVVTGDEVSRRFWSSTLGSDTPQANAHVIVEKGRKGNFLGALQAYARESRELSADSEREFDQLVMLVGSGIRLSPITQALRNMKSALTLPNRGEDGRQSTLTVGEAAIRSSAPWVRTLRAGGFNGVVLRWGDEILIPSTKLDSFPGQYAQADAVRFGYSVHPNELLASNKEWLVSDRNDTVQAELPRQPLERLKERMKGITGAQTLHVNLGSFAASYNLLRVLSQTFADLLEREDVAANWDPYLWMALHAEDEETWRAECRIRSDVEPKDFASLLESIPDFYPRAHLARERLESLTERPFVAKVLDFGEPYWFDAGNHASLRSGLNDVFLPGRDGDTLRAFLGLPNGLAAGDSFVHDSQIAPSATLLNSVVIGSAITEDRSRVERGIVLDSRVGELLVGQGGVVFECQCSELQVEGPSGFAFRLRGKGHVQGDEVAAEVEVPEGSIRLSYHNAMDVVDEAAYEGRLGSNSVSFREAAGMVDQTAPQVAPR